MILLFPESIAIATSISEHFLHVLGVEDVELMASKAKIHSPMQFPVYSEINPVHSLARAHP
jgi:hypothetical protein